MHNVSYLSVCKELVRADLAVFKKVLVDKSIDMGIWVVLTLVVMGYIMPYFGLQNDYGPFQFGGVLAAVGLFEIFANVFDLTADLEGDRVINYSLTLPIPSWMALLSKVIFYAITYTTLSVIMFPLGKICLWNQLPLRDIAYGRLCVAFIVQNSFYACFVLWTTSFIANMSKLGSVWSRVIFPMWFMGGFQFSWTALHAIMPLLAYIDLINPMMYATEITRAALLGQEGYLPFWTCTLVLIIFSVACLAHALKRMKKRLDYV